MSIPSNYRTLEDWYSLIQECRRSGSTDSQWCRENGISLDSFHSAIRRLRKNAYALPVRQRECPTDITRSGQDVVRVNLIRDDIQTLPDETYKAVPHLDNSHTIEISIGNAIVRVCNDAAPELLAQAIRILGGRS